MASEFPQAELRCPHCQQQAMSQLTKSALGPIRSVPCKSCGKSVSVPAAAVLAVLPFLAGIALAPVAWPSPLAWASPLVGFAITCAVHAYKVPLVRSGA